MTDGPKVIVLDRDGVINHDSPDYIKSPDEWHPIEGSLDAIRILSDQGYTIAVATNQSGLARGLFDQFSLAAIHQKMVSSIELGGGALAGIFYCPHSPEAGCRCRKPGTGLLEEIEAQLGTRLKGSALIGDSGKDLQAAMAYGMQPVLVRTGNGSETEGVLAGELATVPVYDNLYDAVTQYILRNDA